MIEISRPAEQVIQIESIEHLVEVVLLLVNITMLIVELIKPSGQINPGRFVEV